MTDQEIEHIHNNDEQENLIAVPEEHHNKEYHGLFKKLTRYLFTCQFCMRSTDVMAYDKEDAGKRIAEKGWRITKIKPPTAQLTRKGARVKKDEPPKEAMMLACKGCARLLQSRNN